MAAKSANLYARIEPDVKEQADHDIRSIYEYIAYELQSPENASGVTHINRYLQRR